MTRTEVHWAASPGRRALVVGLAIVLVVLVAHAVAGFPPTIATLGVTILAALGVAAAGEADRRWNPGRSLADRAGRSIAPRRAPAAKSHA
jgi:hypothetical protein